MIHRHTGIIIEVIPNYDGSDPECSISIACDGHGHGFRSDPYIVVVHAKGFKVGDWVTSVGGGFAGIYKTDRLPVFA